jgi:hypothetical protein
MSSYSLRRRTEIPSPPSLNPPASNNMASNSVRSSSAPSSNDASVRRDMYRQWDVQPNLETDSAASSGNNPMANQLSALAAAIEARREQIQTPTEPITSGEQERERLQRLHEIDLELADIDERRQTLLEEHRVLDPRGTRHPSVAFRDRPELLSPRLQAHTPPLDRGLTPFSQTGGERSRIRIKVPEPRKFEGTTDPTAFNSFRIDAETYLGAQDFGFPVDMKLRLQTFRLLLGDKVKTWFDSNAPQIYEWADDQLFDSLYSYCIPATSVNALYKKYKQCRQKGRRVPEYAIELSTLRTQVGHERISEWQLKYDFLDGLDASVWQRVFSKFSDDDAWDEIVRMATREDEASRGRVPYSNTNVSSGQGQGQRHQPNQVVNRDSSGRPGQGTTSGYNRSTYANNQMSSGNTSGFVTNNRGLPSQNQGSGFQDSEVRAQQRAKDGLQGNCFLCHKPGHRSVECPQRKAMAMKAQIRNIQAECAAILLEDGDGDTRDDLEEAENTEDPAENEYHAQGNELGV